MTDVLERKIGGLTIQILRTRCIASANCMEVALEVFEFDDEKICSFKASIPEIERDRLMEACDVCPADALFVIDETGKQIVP